MQVLLESNAACSRFVVAAASLHSLIGGRQCCHDLFSGSAIERASVARPIFRRHNMRIGHALTVISNSSITADDHHHHLRALLGHARAAATLLTGFFSLKETDFR
jgi:hypothetical protein